MLLSACVRSLRPVLTLALACAAALAAPGSACARDASDGVSGSAALVSDYRFRGLSLSDRQPALQGGIEVEQGGWFGGSWGSTLARDGDSSVELNAYAGRRGKIGSMRYSLTAYAYLAGGKAQPEYLELQGELVHPIGRGEIGLELSYAPSQAGQGDNLYLGGRAAVPLGTKGFSLVARGGFEDGFYDRKLDWEAGAAWSSGPVTVTAALVGARARGGPRIEGDGTGAVFSVMHSW
jgi:uncharacterized protein (TIGR02001 family)